ncbi:MAG TPA: phosphatase PAP2 family protein [Actinomycetales bacterium]|nr:phosphatase PAP2 family protein [Actinomycetales bacterium]
MNPLRGREQAARLLVRMSQSARQRRPHPVREVALILALFLAYKAGRLAVVGDIRQASGNARDVWHLERVLQLPSEQSVQSWLLQSHELTRLANEFYAWVHFPATIAFLTWMWVWRPASYLGARRSLAVVTALALVIHITYPLAPPRLVPSLGMVDTAALIGPAVYGDPRTDTLTNQFAAMPSLHIGWAVIVAIALIRATRTRWRWLWVLHPAVTTMVVVATANHYWADGLAAGLLVAATFAFVMVPTDRAAHLARSAVDRVPVALSPAPPSLLPLAGRPAGPRRPPDEPADDDTPSSHGQPVPVGDEA